MKKNDREESALYLLDDCEVPVTRANDWHEVTEKGLTPPTVTSAPISARVKHIETGVPAALAAKPSNKVFRPQSTLRQMMSEYNRSHRWRAPLKVSVPHVAVTSRDFSFGKVSMMRLPSIPGKILRPTRKPSDADG